MVRCGLGPLHAGDEQCMVTVRDFELCDSWAGAAGGQPLSGTRENTGPRYKSDLRRIESFYRVLKWDYGVLGGLAGAAFSAAIMQKLGPDVRYVKTI